MSVDNSELLAFQNQIQALKDDIPEIMDSLAVGEGRYARDQARKICKEENIVNTGDYRRNFKSGTKAIRAGNSYKIDVFNNLDYAKPLEYGFGFFLLKNHIFNFKQNVFIFTFSQYYKFVFMTFLDINHTKSLFFILTTNKKSGTIQLEQELKQIRNIT